MARRGRKNFGKAWRRPTRRSVPAVVEWERPTVGWRIFTRVLIPLMICIVLVPVSMDLVPSWEAMLGYGVRGTFTAQQCESGKAGCYWLGEFVSDDGTDQRYDVGVDGDSAITAVGQQIPAFDTGDRVDVYPVGGGNDWALVTFFTLLLMAALGTWAAKVPVAALRRSSARRSAARLALLGPQEAVPPSKPWTPKWLHRLLWGPAQDDSPRR